MNKKDLVPDGGIGGLNFVTAKKGNKFYKKWLLAEKRNGKERNLHALHGIVLSDQDLKQFIYEYRNNLGGLSNRDLIYVNGVKL